MFNLDILMVIRIILFQLKAKRKTSEKKTSEKKLFSIHKRGVIIFSLFFFLTYIKEEYFE